VLVARVVAPELLVEPVLAVRRRRRDDDALAVGERREHDVPRVPVRDERGLVDPEDVEAGTAEALRVVGRAELDVDSSSSPGP
jgi:hypothetical protein